MTTLLFEQPWMVGAIGTVLALVTFYGWSQSGNSHALIAACSLLLATSVLFFLNVWVVTYSEEVRAWLSDTQSELENNERIQVKERIHPEASDVVNSYVVRMNDIEFSKVTITKIHGVDISDKRGKPRANIRMNVLIDARMHELSGRAVRWLNVSLEKVDGRWLVLEVEVREPQHAIMGSN
jgi:hypothetical protein